MNQLETQNRGARSGLGELGRLAVPLLATIGLLSGCKAKKGDLEIGEVVRNDRNATARLVASGPGLFAPETVKLGEGTAAIAVRGSNEKMYYIELFDADPGTAQTVANQNFPGPATIENTILALDVGTQVVFPLEVSGKRVFDEAGRGRLDVDAIEILPVDKK